MSVDNPHWCRVASENYLGSFSEGQHLAVLLKPGNRALQIKGLHLEHAHDCAAFILTVAVKAAASLYTIHAKCGVSLLVKSTSLSLEYAPFDEVGPQSWPLAES